MNYKYILVTMQEENILEYADVVSVQHGSR